MSTWSGAEPMGRADRLTGRPAISLAGRAGLWRQPASIRSSVIPLFAGSDRIVGPANGLRLGDQRRQRLGQRIDRRGSI